MCNDSLKKMRISLLEIGSKDEIYFDYLGGSYRKFVNNSLVAYGDNFKYKDFLNNIVFYEYKIEELEYLCIRELFL